LAAGFVFLVPVGFFFFFFVLPLLAGIALSMLLGGFDRRFVNLRRRAGVPAAAKAEKARENVDSAGMAALLVQRPDHRLQNGKKLALQQMGELRQQGGELSCMWVPGFYCKKLVWRLNLTATEPILPNILSCLRFLQEPREPKFRAPQNGAAGNEKGAR
jgi:hypothetical protein